MANPWRGASRRPSPSRRLPAERSTSPIGPLTPPVAESVEPLKLRFPTPLDHGLLQRVIRVLDARGEAIAGEVAVGEDEMSFTFRPASPWRQEAHAVAIETILEDVAGNNFKQTFDLEAKTETTPTDQAVIQLSFSPAAR